MNIVFNLIIVLPMMSAIFTLIMVLVADTITDSKFNSYQPETIK